MASLRRLLVQVSALAEDLPEAAELDINAVVATQTGVTAVDARLRVEARDPRPPEGSLPRGRTLGGPKVPDGWVEVHRPWGRLAVQEDRLQT